MGLPKRYSWCVVKNRRTLLLHFAWDCLQNKWVFPLFSFSASIVISEIRVSAVSGLGPSNIPKDAQIGQSQNEASRSDGISTTVRTVSECVGRCADP